MSFFKFVSFLSSREPEDARSLKMHLHEIIAKTDTIDEDLCAIITMGCNVIDKMEWIQVLLLQNAVETDTVKELKAKYAKYTFAYNRYSHKITGDYFHEMLLKYKINPLRDYIVPNKVENITSLLQEVVVLMKIDKKEFSKFFLKYSFIWENETVFHFPGVNKKLQEPSFQELVLDLVEKMHYPILNVSQYKQIFPTTTHEHINKRPRHDKL